HRRQQDDPAATSGTEPLTEAVAEDQRPAHVDVDLLEVRVYVEVPERPDDGERGVVDEEADVDVDEFGEDAVEIVAVGEVCPHRARLHTSAGGDVVGKLLRESDAPCNEDHVEPAAGAASSQCLAQPLRRSGDDSPRSVTVCKSRHQPYPCAGT